MGPAKSKRLPSVAEVGPSASGDALQLLVTQAASDADLDRPRLLVLAHGAGAPMDSPALETLAHLIAARGVTVARFEFAYMAQRRQGGSKRPPPKMEQLCAEYRLAITEARRVTAPEALVFIGGKSMGGRVASLIAQDLHARGDIAGLICLGYPFHPAGKPEKLRTAHLAALACPTLIVQGTADPLGSREDVAGYALSPAIAVHWIAGGDHDLVPSAGPGRTKVQARAEAWEDAADAMGRFTGNYTGRCPR